MAFAKRILFFLVFMPLFIACSGSVGEKSAEIGECMDEESCVSDPNCMCWCSEKCGFRKKTSSDLPIYVTSRPNGIGCYCNVKDYDNYRANCMGKKEGSTETPSDEE